MDSYYVQKDGQQFGPLTRESLQQYFDAGVFSADDWAVQEGDAEWVPLGNFVQAAAVIPEQCRDQSKLEVQFDETPALASSDVPAGRKRLAIAVLIVGLLGGGTALAFYFIPGSSQTTPHPPSQPVVKNSDSQPKPKPPAIKPPPQVPLPLVVEGPEKLTQTTNAARKGIPLAFLHMSFRLMDGWGIPQNRAQAVADAERAASGQSNVTAKLFLPIHW